ncbi:MAG: hypothetical protein KGN79_10245 [Acidobacteriota bacterium]|nr:hypothetical protein [Acidobacteriota bacterium]
MKLRLWFPALVLGLVSIFALSGCKSAHINVTVLNQTGETIKLVEVDYPSASFGIDTLANGASYQYLIQVRLSGNTKVQYTDAQSKIVKITGPELKEGEQGTMTITLLPDGKANFEPHLK